MQRTACSFLVLLLSLAASLAAQDASIRVFRETESRSAPGVVEDLSLEVLGGATIYSLGEGRARLRYPLPGRLSREKEGRASPVDRLPRKEPDRESFLLRWIDARLHELVPGAGTMEITSFVRRRIGGKPAPRQRGSFLEVEGPDAGLVLARDYLDRLLQSQRHYIDAEFRFVKVGKGSPSPGNTSILEILTEGEMRRQLEETRGREGAAVMMKGRLRVLCGEQGVYKHLNELAYVKDYEITTMQDRFIADPIIDVVQEGVTFDLAGIACPDDGGLSLSVSVALASLMRPIKSVKTRLAVGGGTEVEIQLPEVSISAWRSEDIVLGKGDVGFVVRGLRLTEDTGKGEPRHHDVELYCRIGLSDAETGAVDGASVIAVDHQQKIVLVRFSRLRGSAVPKAVIFVRDGREVGRGEVRDRQGNLLVIRPLSGEPGVGDEVR